MDPTPTRRKAWLLALLAIRTARESERRYRRHGGGAPASQTDPDNTTYAADTFTRADGAIGTAETGGAWNDPSGQFRVLSNRARVANAAALRAAWLDSSQGGAYHQAADGWVRATVPVLGNNGLALRVADVNNLLYCKAAATAITLYRVASGALTSIGSVAATVNAGDEIEVQMSADSIVVLLNNVTQFSVSETQGQSNATHGLCFQDTTSRLDNYSHRNF